MEKNNGVDAFSLIVKVGYAFLLKNNVHIDVIREIKDQEGKYLMLDATINDKKKSLL